MSDILGLFNFNHGHVRLMASVSNLAAVEVEAGNADEGEIKLLLPRSERIVLHRNVTPLLQRLGQQLRLKIHRSH
jgi:hypothetical protein